MPRGDDVASCVESDESDESDTAESAEEALEDASAADDGLEFSEPLEPVVSAKATAGIDAIAAPTPNATASPATRPT
ncbi:hypothetical protein NGTWS1803_13840 [Mycolicibacterium cyprinidarum]|uniref:Uncharacterized protein n=1 Tax=Mycolicibacterium cyprinidarum TaxID=2860311 RepID=A0ABQ4V720_9MYCO|nr:hypothetical protein NGTWS1803_13840 [Mycolicibacterium sp. NGTWS1803]GJF10453.1 hypothetical protein NGTWS1702_06240 [Mycolicibacterium sp. NGTWSNA01]